MSDIWGKIKSAVSKVAPLLGSVIGGPAGGSIGTGVALIAKSLGGNPEDPEEILNLVNNPENIIKLKEIENQHEQALLAISVQREEIELKREQTFLEDRANARQRQIEVTKATGKVDWPTHLLAGIVTTGFFIVLGGLFAKAVPEVNSEILWILVGCLATNFTQVVSYFFGSSMGSAIKNKLIGFKNGNGSDRITK